MDRLAERGVGIAKVTLHVGPGTFRPVRTEKIEEHSIEPERYRIPEETARRIAETKRAGGRVVAVGTTTVRTLEGASDDGVVRPGEGWAGLYIHPPYEPSVIDALLTNFHLPGSSLFLLVCALAGTDRMKEAYARAVRAGYRFYSYGDCCLLLLRD
jgi:S-adenosylmethionine:tRNA ribosyltransferase-isomerase